MSDSITPFGTTRSVFSLATNDLEINGDITASKFVGSGDKLTNIRIKSINQSTYNNNEYLPIIFREKFDTTKESLEDFLRRSRNANINMNEGIQADCENMLQKIYDLTVKADNHDAAVRSRVGVKANRKRTNKRKKGRKHSKNSKKNRRSRRIIKK